MNSKKCTKCKIEKPLTEFYKRSRSKDRHQSQCKECALKQQAEYHSRPEVKEKRRKQQAEYNSRPEVKEKRRKQQAEYRTRPEVKEKSRKQSAEYYSRNKEKKLKQQAEYRSRPEVKEKSRKRSAEYYSRPEVKEKRRKQQAEYYSRNKEKKLKQSAKYRSKRNLEQPNCTYRIKNLMNNKVYIGETTRGKLRWRDHLKYLRGNYHQNKTLQEDFDKYGEEAFEWAILKEFESDDKDALLLEEARTIQKYLEDGVELYNMKLTVDQFKMLEENKDIE